MVNSRQIRKHAEILVGAMQRFIERVPKEGKAHQDKILLFKPVGSRSEITLILGMDSPLRQTIWATGHPRPWQLDALLAFTNAATMKNHNFGTANAQKSWTLSIDNLHKITSYNLHLSYAMTDGDKHWADGEVANYEDPPAKHVPATATPDAGSW